METNIISISGGKDSTAMWLLALERKIPNMKIVFCDVGHEHPKTYAYIDYLENRLGSVLKIKANFDQQIESKRELVMTKWRKDGISETIIENALKVLKPTGVSFLDLCLWKGRFPSTKARFCTQELKSRPMFNQILLPLLEQSQQVISWQGIRADESLARSKLPERESTPEGYEIYRPILTWNVADVFAMHRKYGIEPNPLYLEGMGRVGCMPCIHARKQEIYEIARRYPEEFERVAEWEHLVSKVSKRQATSFFTHDWRGSSITDVIRWSYTGQGGRNYDLFKTSNEIMCSSLYGLCE